MFNAKDFNLKEVIQRRAQKESEVECQIDGEHFTETPPFPIYKSCDGIKNDKIWRHLLRSIIREAKELRP